MKYIAAFITDTHLCDNTIDINKSIFQQTINICKEKGINKLFHGGDFINDRKTKQSYNTFSALNEILSMFDENNIELHGIPGNHSKIDYLSKDSWLDSFRFHPNFFLHSDTEYIDCFGFRFHFVPFFDEKGNYIDYLQKAISNIDVTKTNILLTHCGITGIKNNDGTEVINEIPIDLFLKFDKVMVGHYHEKSTLCNGKIIYFGSAFQANYGEGLEKGITLLREDGELEFIQLDFPKYFTVQFDLDKQTTKEIDSITQDSIKHLKESKDNIRFEFTGSHAKLKSIDKELYTSLGIDVKIKTKEIEEVETEKYQEVKQFSIEDIKNEFKDFCKQESISFEVGLKYLSKKLD
jgi:exonuclease SbcD